MEFFFCCSHVESSYIASAFFGYCLFGFSHLIGILAADSKIWKSFSFFCRNFFGRVDILIFDLFSLFSPPKQTGFVTLLARPIYQVPQFWTSSENKVKNEFGYYLKPIIWYTWSNLLIFCSASLPQVTVLNLALIWYQNCIRCSTTVWHRISIPLIVLIKSLNPFYYPPPKNTEGNTF